MMRKKRRNARNSRTGRPGRLPAQRSRVNRKIIPAFIVLLLFSAASAAVWFLIVFAGPFFSMPRIPVESVRIEGRGTLDSSDILRIAGITKNTNIMELDLPRIRKDLIAREPYIENARIIRNPASGVLDITITLRRPAALVNADGLLLGVDGSGFVIGDIEKIDFKDLPVITGLGVGRTAPGETLKGERINAALRILELSRASGLDSLAPLSEINVSDLRHILVYAGDDGMQIRLSEPGLEDKIKEAAVIVGYLEQKGEKAEYIDLRFRRTVVKHGPGNN